MEMASPSAAGPCAKRTKERSQDSVWHSAGFARNSPLRPHLLRERRGSARDPLPCDRTSGRGGKARRGGRGSIAKVSGWAVGESSARREETDGQQSVEKRAARVSNPCSHRLEAGATHAARFLHAGRLSYMPVAGGVGDHMLTRSTARACHPPHARRAVTHQRTGD